MIGLMKLVQIEKLNKDTCSFSESPNGFVNPQITSEICPEKLKYMNILEI